MWQSETSFITMPLNLMQIDLNGYFCLQCLKFISPILFLGFVSTGCFSPTQEKPSTTPAVSTGSPPSNPLRPINPTDNFVVQVVEQVGPAVVRINASRTVSSQSPNSPFREFFGFPSNQPSERVERGTGSGFIYDQSGLVMTNNHVVADADQVTVVLKDGRQMKGEVLGSDALTDVAVVKIAGKDLPTVKLGNSDTIQPGEWAIAIGNPLGLDNTVTVGIISATGRSSSEVGIPDQRVNFLQTDAAINPGNSGGPLLNQNGQVIGVNTAIISNAQGLGFAIPIGLAQRIASQLAAKGTVERAYIGVKMVNLTPVLAEQLKAEEPDFKITQDKGVLAFEVIQNSPAQKAGIEAGDIILTINGKPIESSNSVQQIVESAAPGDVLRMEVSHKGEKRNIQLTLGTLKSDSFKE